MGFIAFFLFAAFYLLPLVGTWVQGLCVMRTDPLKPEDYWIGWLLFFLSFVPVVNIGVFILLTYTKHN